MNINFQTNNYNNIQYKYRNRQHNNLMYNNQQSFTSNPIKSSLLDPLRKAHDKSVEFIAEKYTAKIYTSKLAKWLADKTDKLSSVVDHMQVIGSTIISAMYMLRTYQNKELSKDKDSRNTLILNQGATFLLSTSLGYVLDSRLDNIWEKFTQNYTSRRLKDDTFKTKITNINKEIIKETEQRLGKSIKDIPKKQRPAGITTLTYLEKLLAIQDLKTFDDFELIKNTDVKNVDNLKDVKSIVQDLKNPKDFHIVKKIIKEEGLETLDDIKRLKASTTISHALVKNIRGMGVLKKLAVFGTVYRFLGPVAVTPLANYVGGILAKHNANTKKAA